MLEFTVPTRLPGKFTERSISSVESTRWDSVTQRINSGDHQAFEVYYEHTFMLMFRQIQRLVGTDEQTTLDIVQMAMLKVIRCIKPLPNEGAVNAWSIAVAKSVAYDWLRKQSRQCETVSSFDNDIAAPTPALNLATQARLIWIEDQLMSLPVELQKLISLRYRMGWSLRRIGDTFGLKTGAVDGRIRRAIESLQEKAHREFDE